MPDDTSRERRVGDAADRAAVSAARLVLGFIPVAGPFLAEAVTLARELNDARDADETRIALDRRFESITQRLADLEAAGRRIVRVSGDRARLLKLTVEYQNEHMSPGLEREDAIGQLGLTPEAYLEAAKELADLQLTQVQGYHRTIAEHEAFVQVVGQVVPGVDVRRELGQLLAVLGKAPDGRAGREAFEALGLPLARTQHLLDYLKERGFIELRMSYAGEDHLLIWYAELLTHGKRVLRGDDEVPGA